MTVSTLKQVFTVSSVPVQVDTSVRINIRKRRERVVYRTITDENNINLAYVLGSETTPSNNLFIVDRSTSIVQNRVPTGEYTVRTTGSLLLNTDKALITDVFTVDQPTLSETPLFYVHTLYFFNEEADDFVYKTLLSVEFTDYTQKTISFKEYYLDTSTGKVYNNITNTYDESSGELDVKYIRYSVRTVIDGVATIDTYHELIDNQPIYEEASWDDIDAYGNIVAGRKKFITTTYPGGGQYLIKLPSNQQYAYKEILSSKIKVLSPAAIDTAFPWNIRITNGNFIASLRNTSITYRNYNYYVAEFDSQLYDPYPPYKLQGKQLATWVYRNLIKVPKNIVREEGLNLYIDILVKDKEGTLYYAFSNDPDKIGTYYSTTSVLYTDSIASVDRMNGFIEIDEEVESDDKVEVYYYTKEDEYLFTAVDFNPITNIDILDQRVVVYVVPETAYTGELDTSLHHLKVDPVGRILYCSQVADNPGSIEVSTVKLRQEDFNIDGSPTHDFYYDRASTASGLEYRASGINLLDIDGLSFIDKYTTESVLFTSQSGLAGTYPASENLRENPHFLVLADITVGEKQSPELLSLFDIRVEGGGIKEDYIDEAILEQPEVARFVDIEGPRVYPSAGTFYIQVPQSLESSHGGDWSMDQIRGVVEKHMRAGGYPVIDTYGLDPVITSKSGGVASLSMSWPSYGSDIRYNVYLSQNMDTGFVLASGAPFGDISTGNSLTLRGLSAPTTYFAYIESIESSTETSKSQVVSVTTELEGSS